MLAHRMYVILTFSSEGVFLYSFFFIIVSFLLITIADSRTALINMPLTRSFIVAVITVGIVAVVCITWDMITVFYIPYSHGFSRWHKLYRNRFYAVKAVVISECYNTKGTI